MRESVSVQCVYGLEQLENRVLLSLVFGFETPAAERVASAVFDNAKGGAAKPTKPAYPIRLDVVALHEFGHSLGLPHSSDASSIMYATYQSGYNLDSFSSDSAVTTLKDTISSSGWVSLDGDARPDLTYSFIPDGVRLEQGKTSDTFATFQKLGLSDWQNVFIAELNRWANASGTFTIQAFDHDHADHDGVEDAAYPFNAPGLVQGDSRFGDIRIATHKFDGALNVLAHAYYPPAWNNSTAAGDAHFDSSEFWVTTESSSLTSESVLAPGTGGLFASRRPISDDSLLAGVLEDVLGA